MASITIRNLDEELEQKLRIRAAERNHSMADEARDILRMALAREPVAGKHVVDAIRQLIEPLGGVDLAVPPRGPMRKPPRST